MSWDFTKPGLQYEPTIDEDGQITPPHVAFFPNKLARAIQFAKDSSHGVQPSTSDITGSLGGEQLTHSIDTTPNPVPKMVQPSLADSMRDPNTGLPRPINSGETKLGKLLHVLAAAAQGGVAALGTQNAQQGMEAARQAQMLPLQHALAAQQLAREQAQTELSRAEVQPVNVPGYGPMPMWLARASFPALIRGQAQQNVEKMKAQTAENVADINKRFISTPVGLFDTRTRQVVPATQDGILVTPEIAEDYNLPPEFVGKPMRLSNFAQLEHASAAYAPTVTTTTQTGSGSVSTTQKTPPQLGNSSNRPTVRPAPPIHSKEQDAADAEVIASGILNKVGGDPDKALQFFDQNSPQIKDPNQRRIGPLIRDAIRARHRINKPENPIDQIIRGDVQGGLSGLQTPSEQ